MDIHEARVLAAANHAKKKLTIEQLAGETGETPAKVRQAAESLAYRGLLAVIGHRQEPVWQISDQGRAYAHTRRGRTVLDVPRKAAS